MNLECYVWWFERPMVFGILKVLPRVNDEEWG